MAWSDAARKAAAEARRRGFKSRPTTIQTETRYNRAMDYLQRKADKLKDVPGKKGAWRKIHAKRNRLNVERSRIAGDLFAPIYGRILIAPKGKY